MTFHREERKGPRTPPGKPIERGQHARIIVIETVDYYYTD